MSTHAFMPGSGPILVEARATGPVKGANLKLVLDTGATTSLISLTTLLLLGIDPNQPLRRLQMTNGSSVQVVPVVMLTLLSALGQHRIGFPVIAHALPKSPGVDGLLGLDFLRGQVLTIDFKACWIDLA
jgi:gag-polyprotein putative aspartyl protease